MKLFKSIDDKFLEIGFDKIIETKYGVSYERINNKYNYMQKMKLILQKIKKMKLHNE